jgi:putative transcriptional regulator
MDHVIGDLATCNLQPHFDRCRLYLGGDVDPRAVQVLHALPAADAPDAQELLPGVRLGGFESVRRALAEGRASPDEVKILTRYAGWGPGQLEAEVARGVWHVAAAAPGAVLAPAAPGRGADMWHAVLRLMGGDYAALSEAARGGLDEEVMGRGAGAGGEGAAGGGRDPEDSWKGSGI